MKKCYCSCFRLKQSCHGHPASQHQSVVITAGDDLQSESKVVTSPSVAVVQEVA